MPGLYVHVPFCWRKCRYCDFYSVALGGLTPAHVGIFLDALARELDSLPAGFVAETVYVGGGTPTALSADLLVRLLECVRAAARAAPAEWTCEANPGTVEAEKLGLLRGAGVNRLSLGVQSFDLRALSFLGRLHSARDAHVAFEAARDAGFENINLDLIYAVPGANLGTLERDLATALELGPEHLSCYALSFEAGTPLAEARDAGLVREVPDEEQARQYERICERLGEAGYHHYEISNWARPGYECRHNLDCWSGGSYIGCGPSAHSHWEGKRWGNVRDWRGYVEAVQAGRSPRAFEERLAPEARARETLMLCLRRLDGVSREEFRRATGFDYWQLCGAEIARLVDEGLLTEEGGRLRLTERALFVSDAVFRELVG